MSEKCYQLIKKKLKNIIKYSLKRQNKNSMMGCVWSPTATTLTKTISNSLIRECFEKWRTSSVLSMLKRPTLHYLINWRLLAKSFGYFCCFVASIDSESRLTSRIFWWKPITIISTFIASFRNLLNLLSLVWTIRAYEVLKCFDHRWHREIGYHPS